MKNFYTVEGVEMEEYVYWTDETEVMEYTRELQNILADPAKFHVLFNCFLTKKMPDLANIMVSMLKDGLKYKNIVKEKETEIQLLKKQIKDKEIKIAELLGTVDELERLIGIDELHKMRKMKSLYLQGYSLRKISEIFRCDKSTVKSKLIKMGISFD